MNRQRQRGVALIIALVLVALATILATKISFDGYLERQRTTGVLAVEQALQFAMGAEAIAADGLIQSRNQSGPKTTLADPWAQPVPPMPITPPNDPEGEPIGTVEGTLEDMQGRFNLNNLARMIVVDSKSGPDPQPLEQFQRLLVSVGLEPEWAQRARDWIDADDVPSPDGAEDAVYTAMDPPYRTGNWPMHSTSELMNLKGFGIERYRRLAPYVTALPTATAINICTAPALVIESLTQNLHGEYSGNPQVLTAGRKTGCFPDVATLGNIIGAKDAVLIAGKFDDKSDYFRLTTHVTLGTTRFTLYSLLQRNGAKFTPLLRSFGTL